MTPKSKVKKAKKAESKRKRLVAPPELMADLESETVDDNMEDMIETDPTAEDRALIEDLSDDESVRNIRASASSVRKGTSSSKQNVASGAPPLDTGATADRDDSAIASGISASKPPETGSNTVNKTSTATSTATGVSASTVCTGAVPKTKAAVKESVPRYEFPKENISWNDMVERSQGDDEVAERRNVFSRLSERPLSADRAAEMNRHVQFMPSSAPMRSDRPYDSISTQQRTRQPVSNPPRLIIDQSAFTAFGDSAYFVGGEYRKPDRRTIYIESIERMYQNTFNDNFAALPIQTLEYHIKSAEKLWDKFLDIHNELYNACETPDQIEYLRVAHRSTQRLYECLISKLLEQLAEVTTRERNASSRGSIGRDEDGLRGAGGIKIDKITIEKFDGRFDKWPQFKRIFETYFHNTGASDSIKMVHLVSHLKPDSEPHNLIRGLDPSGENYEYAWSSICDMYNDKRRILDTLIKSFIDIAPLQTPTRAALMNLVTRTKNLVEPMTTYNIDTSTWGVWIVPIIVRKLDAASRSEWCNKRPQKVAPELKPLLDFITLRADGIDESAQGGNSNRQSFDNNNRNSRYGNPNAGHQNDSSRSNNSNANANPANGNVNRNVKRTQKCPDPLCRAPNHEHQLYNCNRFKSLDLERRRQKVRALGVCELCLRKHCNTERCTMRMCAQCNARHNSWLCPQINRPAVGSPPQAPLVSALATTSIQDPGEVFLATCNEVTHAPLLATAIVSITDNSGVVHQLRALCDPGSQANMITTNAYQMVGRGKTRTSLVVNGVGMAPTSSNGQTHLAFKSRFGGSKSFYMTAMVLKKITTRIPATQVDNGEWNHLQGLPLADPRFNVPADVDILLGASVCADIMKSGIKRGCEDQPIAQCTKIGWIVYGNTHATSKYLQTLTAVTQRTDEPSLDELLTKFWEVEEVPRRKLRTKEQLLCEQIFVANTGRDENGRYIVRIPFKTDAPELGVSRPIAMKRLLQMEARFRKKPELQQNYVKFMAEYLALGHMIEAPPLPTGEPHYYIPHHAASTKKFRVVFDGSSKTSNGVAFNDLQMIGEKLQADLTSITMRFRTHKIALTVDIKKMYRQVLVSEDQRNFQRILWRSDANQPIREYQLTTQTYGLRSAPHNCVRALVQCADDNAGDHPLASQVTKRDFYVDDLISGSDTVANAAKLRTELSIMLNKGCFELAKWATNTVSDGALEPGAEQLLAFDHTEGEENSVLGLRWNPSSDTFRYKLSLPQSDSKITKRRVVSDVARIYDPNGYLSPMTVTAKVLIQKLWQVDCTWDSKIPESIAKEWTVFTAELHNVTKIAIPRWIATTPQSSKELHAFCDASNIAYGCAFYIKTVDTDNNVAVNLVASKTRVAPIKRLTIPRLELCGAHLLAQMLAEVRNVHEIAPESCNLWTDSMIVLHWLHKTPTTARVYVANRAAETAELTKPAKWRHVPTKENPADLASRGMTASDMVNADFWWKGPNWLVRSEEFWPNRDIALTIEQRESMAVEMTPPVVLLATQPQPFLQNDNGDVLCQSSKYTRLIHVTALVMRFIANSKPNSERTVGPVTTEEYVAAECRWIRHEQHQYFAKEMIQIESKVSVSANSKLVGLRPFIGMDGVLRSSSRLANAHLPYDATHPIILSADSKLTALLIRHAHATTLHGGTQLTMHYVRQRYWVPKLRALTKGIIHRCTTCVRQRAVPMEQQMAALPAVRVTPGRAFERSGVDYCGPFYIKARSGRCKTICKAYVAVFICVATRAVHLELVSDLTSNAFIAALSRFASRRGRVHELLSDNGKNFVGADKQLADSVDSWKKLPGDDMFRALHIKWSFIPPVAPHHGGLWEAAVKSTKHHLRRVVGDQQLTFEELSTVLTQVEACLNSRPICRQADDSSDSIALTPGHFLTGGPILTPIAHDHTSVAMNRLQRWKLLQRLGQDFWRRWKDEYLDQLSTRSKWKAERANAAIDDIVLVRAENTPPTQWPIGRVTNVYTGIDGLVRSVDVLSGGNTYHRPITKLVRLPTECSD